MRVNSSEWSQDAFVKLISQTVTYQCIACNLLAYGFLYEQNYAIKIFKFGFKKKQKQDTQFPRSGVFQVKSEGAQLQPASEINLAINEFTRVFLFPVAKFILMHKYTRSKVY